MSIWEGRTSQEFGKGIASTAGATSGVSTKKITRVSPPTLRCDAVRLYLDLASRHMPMFQHLWCKNLCESLCRRCATCSFTVPDIKQITPAVAPAKATAAVAARALPETLVNVSVAHSQAAISADIEGRSHSQAAANAKICLYRLLRLSCVCKALTIVAPCRVLCRLDAAARSIRVRHCLLGRDGGAVHLRPIASNDRLRVILLTVGEMAEEERT